MNSTERNASAGMMKFVLTIFGIAMILAAVYFVFLTPGEPEKQSAPHAVNQEAP